MRGTLRLGIIGCGWIAGDLITIGKLNPRIRFSACADIDRARAEAAGRRVRTTQVFTEYERMLTEATLDAVYVAVPHSLHFPVITRALEAGLHVFTEKPVTTTMEDARSLIELSRRTGRKIGVNYQYRYDPGCYALVRAAQRGDLGRLLYGRCNIPWHREENYFTRSPWHRDAMLSGGGTLITQGSHALDILLWATGARPLWATGVTRRMRFRNSEVEDFAAGIIECGSGVVNGHSSGEEDGTEAMNGNGNEAEAGAVIDVMSSMVAKPEQPVRIELYGERGTAIYSGPLLPRVRFQGVQVRRERLPVWGVHPLARSLEAFRRWVLMDAPYHCSIEDSVAVLATVLALYRSAESGRKEEVRGLSV